MQRICIVLIAMCLCVLPAGRAHALFAMRISNISDFNLPTWSMGQSNVSASMDICIYTNNLAPLGGYAINISSPGGFFLTNGSGNIPYSLRWDDSGAGNLGSEPGSPLTNGVTLTGQLRGNILDNSCTLLGPNARLNLSITQSSMESALSGTYTGTITLLLTPS